MASTPRKSTADQLDELRKKQEALKARMDALAARKKAEDRKRETRRAFVVGAAALDRAENDPAFRKALSKALQASELRDADKAIIADLLGLAEAASPAPAKQLAADKTDAA